MPVRNLQHYCLAVPDPTTGRTFYEDFGLEAREEDGSIVLRCTGREQDQVMLVEGPTKRLHHLCFGTRADEIDDIKAAVEKNGTKLVDPPNAVASEGLWFRDPQGTLVNVKAAEPAPWAGAPEWHINNPGHYDRRGDRACPSRDLAIKPRRLGHVLTFTTDIDGQIDFYTRVLGMRLSDRAQDVVAFLHCEGGSDHHVLAYLTGDRPGFHHASFEVANVDEVGLGGCRMIDKGYRDGWGFGRHVIGSNFFHYIRDPWNSLAEYFCDIDYIPADYDWEAKNWPVEDSLYIWGPTVPEDFGANFEAE